jgi:hypothetical protein
MRNSIKHHLPKYGIVFCVTLTLFYLDTKVMREQGSTFSERFSLQFRMPPDPATTRVKYKLGTGESFSLGSSSNITQ